MTPLPLRARIHLGIAVPAVVVLALSCVAVQLWVRAEMMGGLDRSLEVRAAAMAALVDLDGGVWDVEFDRDDLPVGELFGSLDAYEVRVAGDGGVLASRPLSGATLLTDAAPLAPLDLAALPTDRPLELDGGLRTLELDGGRSLRLWTGTYLVRAHAGEPGEGGRVPVGGAPGPAEPVVRIAVAQDLGPTHADLRALLGIQLATGLALSGAALVSGGLLSRHIVAPLQAIATRAAAVRSPTAEPPLARAGTGDELDRLVEALNESYLRLHAAYALQARFTADASHELRTPLAAIRAQAEVALRQARVAEEYEAVLRAVLVGTARAEGVLDGLLLLARADAGHAGGPRESVDLRALATELADELDPGERGPAVRVEGDGGVAVQADPVQMEVVLRNLLTNALRHTPSTGEIVVRVAPERDLAVLEVRDTGEGIPPEALPHVFERFFRADAARGRDRGGAGLGLSIVQAVVGRHGGTVEAESAPGRGATFRVRLPRAPTRQAGAA